MRLVKKEKKFYTSYSKLSEVKLITIGLASPERIRQWAEKTLPNGKILGEVINANTLHHKTFKPQKGGLFCERIFGPLKDFECACGKPLKNKKPSPILASMESNNPVTDDLNPNKALLGDIVTKTRNFCNTCEVEYTWSVMRRYQLGYIKLISPVTHVWYLKGNPSYLSILLDIKKRHLEYITYCSETLTIENSLKGGTPSTKSSDIVSSWNKLKSQIMSEKLPIEKKASKAANLIQNKLNKRNQIQLKKYKDWKQFSKAKAIDPMVSDFNKKNHNNLDNLENFSFSEMKEIKEIKEMKRYSTQINLKSLQTLSVIITKAKQTKLTNHLEALIVENGSAKQIFKKIAVPSYILLKLAVAPKKSIYNNLTDQVWEKLSEKALKNSLIRVNKISNKIDSISLKQNCFFNDMDNLTESQKNSVLALNPQKKLQNPQPFLKEFLAPPFKSDFIPLQSQEKTRPQNSSGATIEMESYRNSVKSIKNYFYSSLKNYLPQDLLASSFTQSHKDSGDYNNSDSFSDFNLGNREFDLKKLDYLEYYTLSNCSSNNIDLLISETLSRIALNIKPLRSNYKIILKHLSEIFFKLLINNSKNGLKKVASAKAKLNLINGKESSDLTIGEALLKGRLNKKEFKELKNSLEIFYSVGNTKINLNSLDLRMNNFENQSPSIETIGEAPLKQKMKKEFSFKFRGSAQLKEETSFVAPKKKLYNNIYCLSHRERWEVENDWNFLYYFMTSPSLDAPIISNYKSRYENEYSSYFASKEYNSSLTNQNMSFNLQKSAFFSGPGIVQQLLSEFNFYEIKKMDQQNRILLYQLNKQIFNLKKYAKHDRSAKKELKESYKKRDLLIRRTKLVRKLFIKESAPQASILTVLPVLPPDLRPIVKMGGQIAASDLNRLYQRVIYRNDRLKKFLKDPATSHSYEMKYAQRLLQEAVDNLIQNGKSGVVSEKDSRGRALKSLSDILKGKQGRFRQYLLGKRVDYSGRSVIVVGPKLKLHECGIPKEMALELYLPFLLKRILNENLAKTVVGAKTLIKTNPSLIWELLREIMQTCPVLLNRAPTLHRLGIQSFQPKLIDGRAILLHPLVCSAFNADFDGDQMAVHVPITVEARAEAWKLMLSRNNILSPATGDPLAIPSQDMVLGCYYLTTNLLNSKTLNLTHRKGSGSYFSNIQDALKDYELHKIHLHSNIWLKWDGFIENGSDQEEPIEIRIDSYGNWKEIYNKSQKAYNSQNNRSSQYILTTPGKILFNQIIHRSLNGCKFK